MRLTACAIAAAAMVTAGCATGGDDRPDVRSQLRQTFAPQDVVNYERAYDEHLTGCMRDAGFTWTPFRPKTPRERLELTEREFADKYGFGISTLIGSPATAPQADPNAAARAALPEPARTRYDDTLEGCRAKTGRELGPPPNAVMVPNDDDFLQVSSRAEADPRVTEAKRAYAACMATHRIAAESGEAAQTEVTRRATPFLDAFERERQRWRDQGRDPAHLRVDEALSADQVAALTDVQRYELKAAAADRTCGEKLYPVVEQVHAEYTQRYLDGE